MVTIPTYYMIAKSSDGTNTYPARTPLNTWTLDWNSTTKYDDLDRALMSFHAYRANSDTPEKFSLIRVTTSTHTMNTVTDENAAIPIGPTPRRLGGGLMM